MFDDGGYAGNAGFMPRREHPCTMNAGMLMRQLLHDHQPLRSPTANSLRRTQQPHQQRAVRGHVSCPCPSRPMATNSGSNSLRSLTLKQIYDGTSQTPDDNYMVDGAKLEMVTLVGKVVSHNATGLSQDIILDDGTGRMKITFFLDDHGVPSPTYRKGMYVRVHGHIRSFDGQISMNCFRIRPITDYNEVTYHSLQCIFQHLHFTKGTAGGGGGAGPSSAMKEAGYGAALGADAAGFASNSGLTPVQEAVNKVLSSPSAKNSVGGLSTAEIISRLGAQFSPADVRQAVAYLIDQGAVYTGTDEDHFISSNLYPC